MRKPRGSPRLTAKKTTEKLQETKLWKYVKEHKVESAGIVLLTIYLSGLVSQAFHFFTHSADYITKRTEFTFGVKNFTFWCTTGRGVLALTLTVAAMAWAWRFWIYPRLEIKTGEDEGDRKITYADKDTYGTSRMGTQDDMKEVLEIKPLEKSKGIILGLDADGNVITLPTSEDEAERKKKPTWTIEDMINNKRNRNILVLGCSGSMKTRAVIMNMVFQTIMRGESGIITDPKGEIYRKTSKLAEKHGYCVRQFNLKNQEYSDSWNPFHDIQGDSTVASVFADTAVKNASDGKGDAYWDQNSYNMLKACILLGNTENLGALYDFITGKTTGELETCFTNKADAKVALRAFQIFNQCSEVVKGQIINSLGIMIDIFQDEKIRNITSSDEIDTLLPAKEKCMYYVITPDQHSTFDYLALLFWTMAFVRLIDYIDDHMDEDDNPTTLPVNFMFDEFCNLGIIPDFTKKISTVRSRNVNITMIVQNLSQLQNRYPFGAWEEIASNCDTTLFLGCNDMTTAKYISERTGIASIEVESEKIKIADDELTLNKDVSRGITKGVGKREVMLPDEVQGLKNTEELILIRGCRPYKCRKFDYSKHPLSNELEKINISDHVPEWKKAKQKQEEERKEARKRMEEAEAEELERRLAEEEAKMAAEAKAREERYATTGMDSLEECEDFLANL